MSNPNSSSGAAGPDPLSPEEAFALLGNDTRIGILQALWDAFESGTGDNAVPYSELFSQVAMEDSGNFSYHLEKLTGPYVRKTDEGYELKQTGINVVRAVVAGTVIDDPALGPTRVDVTCPRCDAPVEITYADELLDISCTACAGRSRWNDESGHLFGAFVPPLGIEQHTADEAFRAAVSYSLSETAIFHQGVCPHCLGSIETTVEACVDHDPGESLCQNCGRFNVADAWMVCTTCKRSIPPPVAILVLDHPAVTAFYHEHGIEHRFATWETVARSFRVDEEIHSIDPLRLRVSIPAEEYELRIVLDENLNVLDVT